MTKYIMISDAAKEVRVESHVLRYWEEELHLPIKRNELGHRYYTMEDIERFKQIKNMKERGLQLKAIKMILKDGQLDIIPQEESKGKESQAELAIDIIQSRELKPQEEPSAAVAEEKAETREEKARRLQWILQQLIKETLQENNQVLCREVKESVLKELDYQFRVQEEREEERDRRLAQRDEEYYKKMDEVLRIKSGRLSLRERRADRKHVKELNRRERKRRAAETEQNLTEERTTKESRTKERPGMESTAKGSLEKESLAKENAAKENMTKGDLAKEASPRREKRNKKRRHSIL